MRLPRAPRIQPTGDIKIDNALRTMWEEIARAIDGNISFGTADGAPENMAGAWYAGTTGAADTDFTVTHNLGRIPQGWITINIDKAGVIYKGSVPWTETEITLKCSTATTAIVIFVV